MGGVGGSGGSGGGGGVGLSSRTGFLRRSNNSKTSKAPPASSNAASYQQQNANFANYQNCTIVRSHAPHANYGYVKVAPKILIFPIFVQVHHFLCACTSWFGRIVCYSLSTFYWTLYYIHWSPAVLLILTAESEILLNQSIVVWTQGKRVNRSNFWMICCYHCFSREYKTRYAGTGQRMICRGPSLDLSCGCTCSVVSNETGHWDTLKNSFHKLSKYDEYDLFPLPHLCQKETRHFRFAVRKYVDLHVWGSRVLQVIRELFTRNTDSIYIFFSVFRQ